MERAFLRDVPLPAGLTLDGIYEAMEKTQEVFRAIRELSGVNLSEMIQRNIFSGVVSNVFTFQLGRFSGYRVCREDRAPDLMHKVTGAPLEVKATTRPWKGGEGHNGHSGWHIVLCYRVLANGDVACIQAEAASLQGFETGVKSDWKYLGSRRNANDSQRTETYVTTDVGTAKLRDGSLYLDTSAVPLTRRMRNTRRKVDLAIPPWSPFA